MDNWRGNGRKGQPHNNTGTDKKDKPPSGFDGMNYEQKRKPYGEGTSLERDRNRNDGGYTSLERQRDDLLK